MNHPNTLADFYGRWVVMDDGCWNYTGVPCTNGYPQFHMRGIAYMVNRISWEFHNGPIPNNLFVLHRCDNRMCVNPDHLFLGTQSDNVNDMHAKGRGKRSPKMKQTLYNLRSDGDQWRITKFVDGEVESSYLCTISECECPAGHRHTCRHRQMLPQMLAHKIEDSFWFWDFDRHYACDFQGGSKALADRVAVGEALLVAQASPTTPIDPAITESAPQQQASRSWRRL